MRNIVLCFLLSCLSCSVTIPKKPVVVAVVVASEIETPIASPPAKKTSEELLTQATNQLAGDNCVSAIKTFNEVIATDRLNNIGAAFSYWYIGFCWRHLGNMDNAAGAYFSFIVVAQEIMDVYDPEKYTSTGDGFVEEFELRLRLVEAKAYMNLVWAFHSDIYGDSLERPVLVRTMEELEYFVALMDEFCENKCELERSVLHEYSKPVEPHTERLILQYQTKESDFIFVSIGQ